MQLPLNVSPVSASFFGLQRLGIHLVLCVACSRLRDLACYILPWILQSMGCALASLLWIVCVSVCVLSSASLLLALGKIEDILFGCSRTSASGPTP